MRARLITCFTIATGTFGILGAAYSHSPFPLVVMLLVGGVIVGVSMLSLEMDELRRMTRMAKLELKAIVRGYTRRPKHRLPTLQPIKRERVQMSRVNVR